MYHGCTSFPLTGSCQRLEMGKNRIGSFFVQSPVRDHPRSHLFQYFRYQLMMWVGVGLRVPMDLYTIGHFACQRPSFFWDL